MDRFRTQTHVVEASEAYRSFLPLSGAEPDPGLERWLQPPPTAQLDGVRDPGRVRGPQCCFRSGYALTPAAQRNNLSTVITPGKEIQGWPSPLNIGGKARRTAD